MAAQAGYQAIEPWVPKLEQFVKGGGDPKDLAKRARRCRPAASRSSIGFFEWVVDDDTRPGCKALEDARRAFDLGGPRRGEAPGGPAGWGRRSRPT